MAWLLEMESFILVYCIEMMLWNVLIRNNRKQAGRHKEIASF